METEYLCAVFCTSDIPTATLDRLLYCTEEYFSDHTEKASDSLVIIDTKDAGTITKGSSPPTISSPTVFCGHTPDEVLDWFDANIVQPSREGFVSACFIILDDKSMEDDSCVFVCTLDPDSDQDSDPGGIQSLRCTFDIVMRNVIECGIQFHSFEEGSMGSYMRSGVTMTKENSKLVDNGGLYIEDGEVKVDEAWRDFSNW